MRLLGMDVAGSVHPDRLVKCFGSEVSVFLTDLLPSGSTIALAGTVAARRRWVRVGLAVCVGEWPV